MGALPVPPTGPQQSSAPRTAARARVRCWPRPPEPRLRMLVSQPSRPRQFPALQQAGGRACNVKWPGKRLQVEEALQS